MVHKLIKALPLDQKFITDIIEVILVSVDKT